MASGWGNVVQHWQTYLEAYVSWENETHATVEVKIYFHSIGWGYSVRAQAMASANWSNGNVSQFSAESARGATVNQLAATHSVTVRKTESWQQIPVSGWVELTGGYHNGTSTAYATVDVSPIPYAAPGAPSGCSANRISDNRIEVRWQNGSTSSMRKRERSLVERSDNGGAWVQIASVSEYAANYTDFGVGANNSYTYRVRSSGRGGTSAYSNASTPVYTTPAPPSDITITRTGDGRSFRISADTSGVRNATEYIIEQSENNGVWTDRFRTTYFPTSSRASSRVRVRIASVRGDLISPWVVSSEFAAVCPPNAPAITLPSASVVPTGSRLVVAWRPDHPDQSAQSCAEVEITVGSKQPTTETVNDRETSLKLPISYTETDGWLRIRVRTKGYDAKWGQWSPVCEIRVASPPSAHIINPAKDGDIVKLMPVKVAWNASDASGIAHQRLELLDSSGSVIWAHDPKLSERSLAISSSEYLLDNNSEYALRVVVRGGSGLEISETRRFRVEYAAPAEPRVHLETDPTTLAVRIIARAGGTTWTVGNETLRSPEFLDKKESIPVSAPVGVKEGVVDIAELPETTSIDIIRILPDGSRLPIAIGVRDGDESLDRLPPLNLEYEYAVIAHSDLGPVSEARIPWTVDAQGREAYSFGADASCVHLLEYDATGQVKVERTGETFEFALGAGTQMLPTFYPDGGMRASGSHSYTITDPQTLRELLRSVRSRGGELCWFRDHWGGRARCTVEMSYTYAAGRYRLIDVTLTLSEVVWEEPING